VGTAIGLSNSQRKSKDGGLKAAATKTTATKHATMKMAAQAAATRTTANDISGGKCGLDA
jgi:hypothetical protein